MTWKQKIEHFALESTLLASATFLAIHLSLPHLLIRAEIIILGGRLTKCPSSDSEVDAWIIVVYQFGSPICNTLWGPTNLHPLVSLLLLVTVLTLGLQKDSSKLHSCEATYSPRTWTKIKNVDFFFNFIFWMALRVTISLVWPQVPY